MIPELIGGAMIVGSSTVFGFQKSNSLSMRLKTLQEFRSSLQVIETEIVYSATPLPRICDNICDKMNCGNIVKEFYSTLGEELRNGSGSLYEGWNKAVDSSLCKYIKNSDAEIIRRLGSVLGCSDREDQVKHLKLISMQIENCIEEAREDVRKHGKMYKTIGILAGLGIWLIVL